MHYQLDFNQPRHDRPALSKRVRDFCCREASDTSTYLARDVELSWNKKLLTQLHAWVRNGRAHLWAGEEKFEDIADALAKARGEVVDDEVGVCL